MAPKIMGILNVTPDSFSDGGEHFPFSKAAERALQMIEEGVDLIDVGGESTRPGASPVSVAEELDRVIPILQFLRRESKVPLSVDTTKARVALEAVDAGASIINDVSGLTKDPEMMDVVLATGAQVILMHSRGTPQTMDSLAHYENPVDEVIAELEGRVQECLQRGVLKEKIWVDPGFGFAKDTQQNIEVLKRLGDFKKLGCPLVVGLSRKRFVGEMIGGTKEASERKIGSLAANLMAALKGADVLRVHDVKETKQVLNVLAALKKGEE